MPSYFPKPRIKKPSVKQGSVLIFLRYLFDSAPQPLLLKWFHRYSWYTLCSNLSVVTEWAALQPHLQTCRAEYRHGI